MRKRFGLALLLTMLSLAVAATSFGALIITVVPPVLPVYTLPVCPQPGFLWTPGYWAYDDPAVGYYWVPGVWLAPPAPGLLWTPPYWGFEGAAYVFHPGYWGPHIGFYGGINYGFGYYGTGFVGGEWAGGVFRYNTAVLVGVHGPGFTVFANPAVVVHGGVNFAFNGPGGVVRGPLAAERIAEHDRHIEHTEAQMAHFRAAREDRANRFAENHGRPAHAAMARAAEHRAEEHRAVEHREAEHKAAEHKAAEHAATEHRAAEHPAARGGAARPAEHAPARGGAAPHAAPAHPAGGAAKSGGAAKGAAHPAPKAGEKK